MRTIPAYFSPRQHNLKAEVRLDLTPQPLQRFAEKLLDFPTAKADHMRVILFAPRFVVMLLARLVHEVEFVNEAAFFQEFQRAVHGDPVELRIAFLGQLKQPFGVEMLPGLVDQIEEDLPLPRQLHAVPGNSGFRNGGFRGVGHEDTTSLAVVRHRLRRDRAAAQRSALLMELGALLMERGAGIFGRTLARIVDSEAQAERARRA